MKSLKKIRIIALFAAALMFLCSCTANEDIPVLQEPVGSAPTYRPVFRTDISTPKVIVGNISGTDYCHFYEKSVYIKKINVKIGDHVEEGDVLVEADTDSIRSQIDQANSELQSLIEQHSISVKKHDLDVEKIKLEKEQLDYEKNMGRANDDMVKAKEKETEAFEENYKYDEEMYEFSVRKLKENISELNKVLNEGVIKAKHSGYVTYIKDMKDGRYVGVGENLVIVTDTEDKFISANIDLNSFQYAKYATQFAFVNGEKIPITQMEYTESEVAYSKVKKLSPVVRFKADRELNMEVGEFILLVFYNNDKNDSLVVGKDSYMTDETGVFVYVKNDDGTLEKRYFEAGTSDDNYVEVVSGLEEGELVLYTQEATLPKMADTYEIKTETYKLLDSAKGIKYIEESAFSYEASDKGVVEEIYVHELDEVKKGDALIKIAIDSQKGNIVSIENQIKSENNSYDMFLKDADKTYEKTDKSIKEGNLDIKQKKYELDEVKKLLESDDLSESERMELAAKKAMLEDTINTLTYSVKLSEMDLRMLDYDRDSRKKEHTSTLSSLNKRLTETKKENDGTGYKTIYAECDGIISSIKVDAGDRIKEGKKLVETVVYFDDVIKVATSTPQAYGYDIPLIYKDTEYKAKVIAGNTDKYAHIFTENGKVKSTEPAMDIKNYCIQLEDTDFFDWESQFMTMEVVFDKMRLEGQIAVPGDFIFKEKSFDGEEYEYVWVLNGDEAYKKYVVTGTNKKIGQNIGNESTKSIILKGLSVGDILVN